MSNKLRWKFLYQDEETGKITSKHGKTDWQKGKWEHVEGSIGVCSNGLHCSKEIGQAFGKGEILARVEVKGESSLKEDKEAWSDMRIVKLYRWKKEDSVKLSIFAAELVIDIFEKQYPNDKRPRKAIEAARNYLKDSIVKNLGTIMDIGFAAHDAATDAPWTVKTAASAASWATMSTISSATWANVSATWAIAMATDARDDLIKKIEGWLQYHVKELEEL